MFQGINLRKRQREEMASEPNDEDLASAAGMKPRISTTTAVK